MGNLLVERAGDGNGGWEFDFDRGVKRSKHRICVYVGNGDYNVGGLCRVVLSEVGDDVGAIRCRSKGCSLV